MFGAVADEDDDDVGKASVVDDLVSSDVDNGRRRQLVWDGPLREMALPLREMALPSKVLDLPNMSDCCYANFNSQNCMNLASDELPMRSGFGFEKKKIEEKIAVIERKKQSQVSGRRPCAYLSRVILGKKKRNLFLRVLSFLTGLSSLP